MLPVINDLSFSCIRDRPIRNVANTCYNCIAFNDES